jgi:hypothetical protein
MPSKEVRDATGNSPEHKSAVEMLTEKRELLDKARKNYATAKSARDHQAMSDEHWMIDSLLIIIRELEVEANVEREAAGRGDAERRMIGIKKAYGSVLDEYSEDDQRVEQSRKQLAEAITKRNARAAKLTGLEKEANALADRFGISQPKFAAVAEPKPIDLPRQWRTTADRPDFEDTKDGTRRSRRTYAEASGSDGYAIIEQAGLKPFRPLTPAETEALSEKENHRPDPVLAQAVIEARALGNLRAPSGDIARG